jgi:hypothetical protein
MPQTTINVYDRNTIETEKVKGWEMCRVFKASVLNSSYDADGSIAINTGTNYIKEFTQTLASNYKGTNKIDLSKLNDFNSFRITAQGVIALEGQKFRIGFELLDDTYSSIAVVQPNYGNGQEVFNHPGGYWVDWYLDIEVTYYKNDGGYHSLIINGNYKYSNDKHPPKIDVSLIPICGVINNITQNNVYFDLVSVDIPSNCYLKQVNIDFVE